MVHSGHLAKHDSGVTVQECNACETLAVLEGVDHDWLLGHADHASCVVSLELDDATAVVLDLVATSVLTLAPNDLDDTASGTTATDVADGGVAALDGPGDVEHLNIGLEVRGRRDGGVLLVDHDITDAGHVLLVKILVVHLHGEDLARAGSGVGVGGKEENLLAGLDTSLLDAASEHITDTLDLVHTRHGEAHCLLGVALCDLDEVVQSILEGVHWDSLLLADLALHALPPAHVARLLEEVVTAPAGDGDDGNLLLDEALGPADLDEHALHLVADLVVALLLVEGEIGIHLVDTDDELLDTQQVDEASVLAGLALHDTLLVVSLLDSGGEVTIGGHHQDTDISLCCSGNHVLDEVTMARSVDYGVVVLIGEELLGGAFDGHTALALVLLGVHVESESERPLTDALGLFLELLHLALRDTSQLEEKATGGGRLARVDVAANNDGHVSLFRHGDEVAVCETEKRNLSPSLSE